MTDFSHLDALTIRLQNEKGYLAKAKTEQEKALRTVWIAQIEKEIKVEEGFCGPELTDDELLAELAA